MAGRTGPGAPVRWKSDQIKSLSLHRRAGLAIEHVPFVILYAVVLYQIYATFGLPYLEALEVAAREVPPVDSVDGFLPPCKLLPSEYVPSFASRLYLAAVVVLHCLMWLMQRWSVNFRTALKFRAATLRDATHAKVAIPCSFQPVSSAYASTCL